MPATPGRRRSSKIRSGRPPSARAFFHMWPQVTATKVPKEGTSSGKGLSKELLTKRMVNGQEIAPRAWAAAGTRLPLQGERTGGAKTTKGEGE